MELLILFLCVFIGYLIYRSADKPDIKKTTLKCKQCNSEMHQAIKSSGNFQGIILALILFFIGLFIVIYTFITIVGPIIGVLIMLYSLSLGGKREKIWRCKSCGYSFIRT